MPFLINTWQVTLFASRQIQSVMLIRLDVCVSVCAIEQPTFKCPGDFWLKGILLVLACIYIKNVWGGGFGS